MATSTAQWFSEQQSGVRSADNRVADREIATAITALDAVSLALAGAAMTGVEREATDRFERAGHEADRG